MTSTILFLKKFIVNRWKHISATFILILLPVTLIQYILIKGENDIFHEWLFNERKISNDAQLYLNPETLKDKVVGFCNLPLTKFNEGELKLGNEFKLFNLIMFAGHGQRSSSYIMKNKSYEYYINCSSKNLPEFFRSYFNEFFKNVKSNFNYKETCLESQLTLAGILQASLMGVRIKNVYNNYLTHNNIEFIYSFYSQNVLSAKVLLYFINYHKSNADSNLPLKISRNLFCPKNSQCNCNNIRYYYTEYNRRLTQFELENIECKSTLISFNKLFSNTAQSNRDGDSTFSSFSMLFDIVSTALCSSNIQKIFTTGQFCWPNKGSVIHQNNWDFIAETFGEKSYSDKKYLIDENEKVASNKFVRTRCLSLVMIENLWNCFDWRNTFVVKDLSFKKFAKLATFFILNDTLVNVIRSARHYYKTGNNSENFSKFIIGDEDTLRYLVNSLDFKRIDSNDPKISNKSQQYRFIDMILHGAMSGFSSRLIMETFLPLTLTRSYTLNNISKAMRFRLLYNGIDLTSELAFCDENCSIMDFYNYLHNHQGFWHIFESNNFHKECDRVGLQH